MQAKFSIYRCALTAIALAGEQLCAMSESTPSSPPEVKKTVDMLVGHWTLTGTDMEPGAQAPAPVKATIRSLRRTSSFSACQLLHIVPGVPKNAVGLFRGQIESVKRGSLCAWYR